MPELENGSSKPTRDRGEEWPGYFSRGHYSGEASYYFLDQTPCTGGRDECLYRYSSSGGADVQIDKVPRTLSGR